MNHNNNNNSSSSSSSSSSGWANDGQPGRMLGRLVQRWCACVYTRDYYCAPRMRCVKVMLDWIGSDGHTRTARDDAVHVHAPHTTYTAWKTCRSVSIHCPMSKKTRKNTRPVSAIHSHEPNRSPPSEPVRTSCACQLFKIPVPQRRPIFPFLLMHVLVRNRLRQLRHTLTHEVEECKLAR
jgi:hypothetical protein